MLNSLPAPLQTRLQTLLATPSAPALAAKTAVAAAGASNATNATFATIAANFTNPTNGANAAGPARGLGGQAFAALMRGQPGMLTRDAAGSPLRDDASAANARAARPAEHLAQHSPDKAAPPPAAPPHGADNPSPAARGSGDTAAGAGRKAQAQGAAAGANPGQRSAAPSTTHPGPARSGSANTAAADAEAGAAVAAEAAALAAQASARGRADDTATDTATDTARRSATEAEAALQRPLGSATPLPPMAQLPAQAQVDAADAAASAASAASDAATLASNGVRGGLDGRYDIRTTVSLAGGARGMDRAAYRNGPDGADGAAGPGARQAYAAQSGANGGLATGTLTDPTAAGQPGGLSSALVGGAATGDAAIGGAATGAPTASALITPIAPMPAGLAVVGGVPAQSAQAAWHAQPGGRIGTGGAIDSREPQLPALARNRIRATDGGLPGDAAAHAGSGPGLIEKAGLAGADGANGSGASLAADGTATASPADATRSSSSNSSDALVTRPPSGSLPDALDNARAGQAPAAQANGNPDGATRPAGNPGPLAITGAQRLAHAGGGLRGGPAATALAGPAGSTDSLGTAVGPGRSGAESAGSAVASAALVPGQSLNTAASSPGPDPAQAAQSFAPTAGLAGAGNTANSAPPAPADLTLPEPVTSPLFAGALGAQLSMLAKDGIQTAVLQLNPAEMGPITVQIALEGLAARVEFQAARADTRDVIQASLPALAGALQEAGLTLAGGGVFDHGQGRQPQADPQASDSAADGAQRGTGSANRVGASTGQGSPGGFQPRASAPRGLVDLVA